MQSTAALLFGAIIVLLQISSISAVCNLCQNGVEGLHYPYAVVKSDGSTCTQLALDLALGYAEGTTTCNQQIQAWRPICCGDNEPIDVEVTEVFDQYPDIDSIETIGPYEKCNVCRDGDYPSASSMVITMLYVGTGSCPQYWKAGQQGLIPTHLCDPLQYFAYEPCGCGEFSTNGNYNWGDSSSSSSSSSTATSEDDDGNNWWSGADSSSSSSTTTATNDGQWWGNADSSLPTASDTNDDSADSWWEGADSVSSAAAFTRIISHLGYLFLGTAALWMTL